MACQESPLHPQQPWYCSEEAIKPPLSHASHTMQSAHWKLPQGEDTPSPRQDTVPAKNDARRDAAAARAEGRAKPLSTAVAAPHALACLGRRGGDGDEGGADGAALGVDADTAGGDRNEGRRNIQPLGLNVDTDGEDGDEHLREG